jgi:hypothetical protein
VCGFRFKVSGLHLFVSVIALALMIGVFYSGWYRWPNWYLLGADKIVGILVLVDVGLGPLATLVVSNPLKPRKELRRDIGMIVLIQVVALGYGVGTLWAGRPLFIAYSLDRVEIVPSAAFDEEPLEKARQLKAPFTPNWASLPQWIWAPLPDDPEERENIIAKAVFGGPDVISMPQHFRPLKDAVKIMQDTYMPARVLLGSHGLNEVDYQSAIDKLGRSESELGVLPVQGRTRDGAWVFERASGTPLKFFPVVVWDMKQPEKQ